MVVAARQVCKPSLVKERTGASKRDSKRSNRWDSGVAREETACGINLRQLPIERFARLL